MIFHVCSHFGDIEIIPGDDPLATMVRRSRLTPTEKEALTRLFQIWSVQAPLDSAQGMTKLPVALSLVAHTLGATLFPGKTLITAVKWADGTVAVSKAPNWWRRLLGVKDEELHRGHPWVKQTGETKPPHLPEPPQAAVQVTMPRTGCPMPTATELKEIKAAAVVRKFLTPVQQRDFDNERAFVAVGNWTGNLYRLTSRWNPACERLGVLRDMSFDQRVCASNLDVPPSEEIPAMKFAVEQFERTFRHSERFGNSGPRLR